MGYPNATGAASGRAKPRCQMKIQVSDLRKGMLQRGRRVSELSTFIDKDKIYISLVSNFIVEGHKFIWIYKFSIAQVCKTETRQGFRD